MRSAKVWVLALLAVIAYVSCGPKAPEESVAQFDRRLETYVEILTLSLNQDTLQQCFYCPPGSTSYPITIADEWISSLSQKPEIDVPGREVRFVSKEAADSAGLPAYFWVIDYMPVGHDARIQLMDPIRQILFGASYSRSGGKWKLVSVYLDEED